MIICLYRSESRVEAVDGSDVAARAEHWSFEPIAPASRSQTRVWRWVLDGCPTPTLKVKVPVGSTLQRVDGRLRLFGHFSKHGMDAWAVMYNARQGNVFCVVEPAGDAK